MHENQVPYFVCTLGRAQKIGRHHFLSLNHLVDSQATHAPDAAVLGMPVPREGAWECQTLCESLPMPILTIVNYDGHTLSLAQLARRINSARTVFYEQ
jgi:hypothetical protein